MGTVHTPVLLRECIEGLAIAPGDVVVDGTAGGGGHALAIAERIGKHGTYIGIDLDALALARVGAQLSKTAARVVLVEDNYRNLRSIAENLGLSQVDRVLIDLGLSSDQLERSGRGFSFSREEPLLMTFRSAPGPEDTTAYDAVNSWSEATLADVIYAFGDEPKARKIARLLCERRQQGPIETSWQLAALIAEAVGARGKIHPATKTFQALRMAVNDELGSLADGMEAARALLGGGGRLAVISFESVTDRLVKTTFRDWKSEGDMQILTRRPITAAADELRNNPRARSAKLRIAQKSVTRP